MDIVYTEAKTRDIGRLAHGDIGRKNPGPRKLINKAVDTKLVLQDPLIGSLLARGPKGLSKGAWSQERRKGITIKESIDRSYLYK